MSLLANMNQGIRKLMALFCHDINNEIYIIYVCGATSAITCTMVFNVVRNDSSVSYIKDM